MSAVMASNLALENKRIKLVGKRSRQKKKLLTYCRAMSVLWRDVSIKMLF